jgi:ADP-heptose:LPS heptosyltransferase
MTVPPFPPDAHLLLVRLDNAGDVLLLGPALRALRARAPRCHITLLASKAGAAMAAVLAEIDDVVVAAASWQRLGPDQPDPSNDLALVRRLAAARFDAALIFTSWAQSPWPAAFVCHLARIPVRAGESKEFGGALLTHRVPCLGDEVHQVDRNLHLLSSLGIEPVGTHLEVAIPPADEQSARALLDELDAPQYAVVAPGASCSARRYPAPRFAEVVVGIRERLGLPVVTVGAPSEATLAGPVRAVTDLDLVGRTSLGELAVVLRGATIAVTNDSGPMHLADAVATPQVVLYSGTELESQWRPRGGLAELLSRPTPCTPCYRFECDRDLACLDVSPREVVDRAALLASKERR